MIKRYDKFWFSYFYLYQSNVATHLFIKEYMEIKTNMIIMYPNNITCTRVNDKRRDMHKIIFYKMLIIITR